MFWTTGAAARDGMGGRIEEPGVLCGWQADSGEGSHLDAGRPDGVSGDVQEGRS